MSTIVIMPGGFHPFHAGHLSLYNSAQRAFPDAEVFVAATNDTSNRPFPFAIKEKLAQLAGVEPGHFVQVKSPFRAEEITAQFNPEQDQLIFVRSEKDATKPPQAGGNKKDGSPAYLQPLMGAKKLEPFARHAYMAYLPTVEFGPGMTSATEIRAAWPGLNEKRKTALVMSLYPQTQSNPKLAQTVVKMLDTAIGSEGLEEGWKDVVAGSAMALGALGAGAQTMPEINVQQAELTNKYYNALVQRAKEDGRSLDTRALNFLKAKAQDAAAQKVQQTKSQPQTNFPSQGSERRVSRNIDNFEESINPMTANTSGAGAGMKAGYATRENQPPMESHTVGYIQEQDPDYIEEKWSQKYKSSINCANPKGFSQRAHCAGRKKNEAQELDEKCWDTHRQVGMKKKGNRMVPNCVPQESVK